MDKVWKQELLRLPGRQDEIEWLKDRLETMSVNEEISLSALCQRQSPETAAHVIRHILSIPSCQVYINAGSYIELAEYFFKYENDVELSPEVLNFVDKTVLGIYYSSLHPGSFVRNFYVECPMADEDHHQYDGINLPPEKYDWSLRLKLASAARPDGVWVCLPDYNDWNEEGPGELEIALEELKVEHINQCTLLDARCVLPGVNDLMTYNNLDSLFQIGQYLGIRLDARGEGRRHYMEHLMAALELEGCNSLTGAVDIEENLDCYDLVMASELEAHGREMIQQTAKTILDSYIDYEGYARQILEQKGFRCVLDGEAYIVRNSQTFVSDYVQSSPEMAWKQELLRLPGRQEEIEWLKDRLEVMSVREEIILTAACQRQPPETAADAIDDILSIPHYDICAKASSCTDLGIFFMKYETIFPNHALAFVDAARVGERYMKMHPGSFIRNNYVTYPKMDVPLSRYDGVHLPQQDYDWSLRLKLGSAAKPDGVWICLPDYDEINEDKPGDIQIALKELDVERISECTLLDARCSLPEITGLMDYDDLADLIYDGENLGILLDERGQGQPHFMEHFLAALELEDCDSLREAIDIAQNLRCYDLVLASDLERYGQEAFQHGYTQKGSEIFGDCIDYEGYARQALEQKGFQCVLDGEVYIARNDQTFISDYVQSSPEMTM